MTELLSNSFSSNVLEIIFRKIIQTKHHKYSHNYYENLLTNKAKHSRKSNSRKNRN